MQADKKKVINLLKTVKGQIDGLINMAEEDRYCIDISTQIFASISILKKINLEILKAHFTHCVKNAMKSKNKQEGYEKTQEMVNILNTILK